MKFTSRKRYIDLAVIINKTKQWTKSIFSSIFDRRNIKKKLTDKRKSVKINKS